MLQLFVITAVFAFVPRPLNYPFEPRSNAYLRQGQFWSVPLSDGRFACGRVLAVMPETDDPFLIRETGGAILGCRELSLEAIRGLREVTHRAGGVVYLDEGAQRLRPATREEAATLPVHSTWGYKVIERVAERLFVEGSPVP